ncbi:MAG: hypothetical protein KY457_00435 [Actinobacteria bacterium]|nr:hypothetical protein [Actinomycetota bacterium]
MRLSSHGLSAVLPSGWEGAFTTAREAPAVRTAAGVTTRAVPSLPTLHLANFALPPDRGDFGSGAVDVMGARHAFVSVLEYGPECVGTALFSEAGLPRHLTAGDFSPRALQRTRSGQAGLQVFFTEAGRAFCLYVVLGHRGNAATLAGEVSRTLANVTIGPAA